MPHRTLLTAFAALALLAPGALAQDDAGPAREIQQLPPVQARYRDVSVTLRSPFFEAGRTRAFAQGEPAAGFTTHAEMERFIAALGNATNLGIGSIGRSREGRDIPYLLFSAEGARTLEEAARNRPADRPTVWLIGLHHGNEPAGGEGLLALARDLATGGDLAELVQRVTVVIVPRANPDGAEAFTRDTADKMDANRDHLLLTLPETRALHAATAILPPDLVIDAHEFTVGGRWLSKFQALHAADFIYMRATHPMVPAAATKLADEVFLPAIEAAAASAGLTTFVYQTSPNARPEDKTVATGGNAAGIARNAFGLAGAVSILLETRGIGIGAQSFQRRVATHYLAASGALRAAAQDPARLARTAAEARREAASSRADLVVAHRIPVTPGFVPLLDPDTGAPRPHACAVPRRTARGADGGAPPSGSLRSHRRRGDRPRSRSLEPARDRDLRPSDGDGGDGGRPVHRHRPPGRGPARHQSEGGVTTRDGAGGRPHVGAGRLRPGARVPIAGRAGGRLPRPGRRRQPRGGGAYPRRGRFSAAAPAPARWNRPADALRRLAEKRPPEWRASP